jgi:hypothetical protein
VWADKLGEADLFSAMRSGKFYASTGVSVESYTVTDTEIRIKLPVAPGVKYTVEFVGPRIGDPSGEPSILGWQDTPSEASYSFDGTELYVRPRVISSEACTGLQAGVAAEPQRAWMQPVIPGTTHWTTEGQ